MITSPTGAWQPIGADPESVLAPLRRRYPRICMWWGENTRGLWALVGENLIEARDPNLFAAKLHMATHPPYWVRPKVYTRGRRQDMPVPQSPPAPASPPAGRRRRRGFREWCRRFFLGDGVH